MAHWLSDRGFQAYAVRGGVSALLGETLPKTRAEEQTETPEPSRALAALQHPKFRIYAAGVLFSLTGNWVEAAAFGWVVLELGGSAATLGLIGFLNTIPNLVFGLPAGALADRYDRRTLLFIFQGANMLVALLLATLWATDNLTVVLMGVIAVVGGALGTLSFPAFQGMLATTVPDDDLESAVAINSLSLQVARFVGPAVAGFLLASVGVTAVFTFNAITFLAVLGALVFLPASRGIASGAAGKLGGAMADGVRYVRGHRSLSSLMLLMILAGLFATPPVAFMVPGIVRFQLDAGAVVLGLLTAAIGLGSLLGALALLVLSRRPNKGESIIIGFALAAGAIAGIGLSTSVALSLALAVVGGLGGVVFVGLSTAVVQLTATDEMRSRAMAIWAAAFVGVLPIGALITAGLAAAFGPGGAVFVDGMITLVGGLVVLLRRPEVRWLGCAALPEACVAAILPPAIAYEERHGAEP